MFKFPLPPPKKGFFNTVKARCKFEVLSMFSYKQSTSTTLSMESRQPLHGTMHVMQHNELREPVPDHLDKQEGNIVDG